MEPNYPRNGNQPRGKKAYFGRRYKNNLSSPSYQENVTPENVSVANPQTRQSEESTQSSSADYGASRSFGKPQGYRGHQYYPMQQVPGQEYNSMNPQSRNKNSKRRGESQVKRSYHGPSENSQVYSASSISGNTTDQNLSSYTGYSNEGDQACSSNVEVFQEPGPSRPTKKKIWQQQKNKHLIDKSSYHEDLQQENEQPVFRAQSDYYSSDLGHQPFDQIRKQYNQGGFRQRRWNSGNRGRFYSNLQDPTPTEPSPSREGNRRQRGDVPNYERTEHGGVSSVSSRSFGAEDARFSADNDRKPPRFRKSRGYKEISQSQTQHLDSNNGMTNISVKVKKSHTIADSATQRERLSHQLSTGSYECMVCFEPVKQMQSIWNCGQCYHAFHLACIQRWAKKSQDENKQWRCPGCQSVNGTLPNDYLCYCLKQKDPEWNRREVPHSCGEVCRKALGDGVACIHTCTLLCHPGPCPVCSAQTQRTCPCGKTSKIVKCGSSSALLCDDICGKLLTCGLHRCEESCHTGSCGTCPIKVKLECFCGQSTKEVPCNKETDLNDKYCCNLVCDKDLSCEHHKCEEKCHPGSCKPCKLEVAAVTSCPCGKTSLKELAETNKSFEARKKCTDPVPVCGQACGRAFSCGPSDSPHSCTASCHMGPCPPCPLKTPLRCRCGRTEKKVLCKDLSNMAEVLCEKRCNKKRQCGRHKCIQTCCVDVDHICPLVCGRTLSCGLHRCEVLCHTGNCIKCHRVSFDELRCHCESQVIYPPVPCGTRPPECNKPCTRTRPCGHAQQHNCHSDINCPPCTTLCEKYCYGKHELRKNIPCHVTEVSCGKPCGRSLKCGKHTCPVICHTGPCPNKCSQPCPEIRTGCGHACALPCHKGACPASPCREKIKVQCQCGQRSATVSCEENEVSYRKLATSLLAIKMAEMGNGQSVELKDLLGKNNLSKTKCLECNEECAVVERNRRLALALQIKNPNPKPGAPLYSEFLKDWAKKDPYFAQMVHDKISELVQLAKQSVGKMKSRSYSFEPMNRDKRQFIHEYCGFFGCESMSYDDEPKRNVVATAIGEVSFLPSVGLVDVVRRELGQRKMPAPPKALGTINPAPLPQPAVYQPLSQTNAWGQSGSGAFRTLSEVVKSTPSAAKSVPESSSKTKANETSVIDYFDFTS